MHGTVTQSTFTLGATSQGYTLGVTYRVGGSPHVWLYGEWRQLQLGELHDILFATASVLEPGCEFRGCAGQLTL